MVSRGQFLASLSILQKTLSLGFPWQQAHVHHTDIFTWLSQDYSQVSESLCLSPTQEDSTPVVIGLSILLYSFPREHRATSLFLLPLQSECKPVEYEVLPEDQPWW